MAGAHPVAEVPVIIGSDWSVRGGHPCSIHQVLVAVRAGLQVQAESWAADTVCSLRFVSRSCSRQCCTGQICNRPLQR